MKRAILMHSDERAPGVPFKSIKIKHPTLTNCIQNCYCMNEGKTLVNEANFYFVEWQLSEIQSEKHCVLASY